MAITTRLKNIFFAEGAKSRRPRGNSKHCHDGICGTFQFSAHPAIVSMSGEKSKAAISFQDSCKYFAGVFISGLARIADVRRRPVGAGAVPDLASVHGVGAKKFPNSNPQSESGPTLLFFRNLPLFPAISVSEFFQTSMESGKECFTR